MEGFLPGFRRLCEIVGTFFVRLPFMVKVIDRQDFVGCTSCPGEKAVVVLSETADLYKEVDGTPMSSQRKTQMALGVFVHECLHLLFSDFRAMEIACKQVSDDYGAAKAQFFALVENVIEDPSIEYFAGLRFGGHLLKALELTVAHTYDASPAIDEIRGYEADQPQKYACQQVMAALLQVGDGGEVKGKFLSPEAEATFNAVLPIFNEAVCEPSGAKRVRLSRRIFEALLPLYDMQGAAEVKESSLKPCPTSGNGRSQRETIAGGGEPTAWQKQKKRKRLAASIGESENSDSAEQQEGAPASESQQGASENSDSAEQQEGAPASESRQGASENSDSAEQKEQEGEKGDSRPLDFDQDDLRQLLDSLASAKEQEAREEKAAEDGQRRAERDIPKNDEIAVNRKQKACEDESHTARYASIVSSHAAMISMLTKSLKDLFASDVGGKKYSTSGTVDLRRVAKIERTPNIGVRKNGPSELWDMAVLLCIDMSGSMASAACNGRQTNIECSATAAICLYEALSRLKIPVWVLGFTGLGSRALHAHCVTWNSPRSDRFNMLALSPQGGNYDSFTIQSASQILAQSSAKHKLMLVLSDGMPNDVFVDGKFVSGKDATRAAIIGARKKASVLGIGMNCSYPEQYREMYGKDFIAVSTAEEVAKPVIAALKGIIKHW